MQRLEGSKPGSDRLPSLPLLTGVCLTLASVMTSTFQWLSTHVVLLTTFSDGCLGSHNDEGRNEVCDKHCELQNSVNR